MAHQQLEQVCRYTGGVLYGKYLKHYEKTCYYLQIKTNLCVSRLNKGARKTFYRTIVDDMHFYALPKYVKGSTYRSFCICSKFKSKELP